MMNIKNMSQLRWLLMLTLSLLLSILLYGLSAAPAAFLKGWPLWLASVLTSVLMLGLYAVFVHWFEGKWPQDLPLRPLLPQLVLGLFFGVLYFVIIVGVMTAFCLYRGQPAHPDNSLILDAFFSFLVVGVGEELVFRGVLFRWIDDRYGLWWALAISALVFGLVHITNDNASIWSSITIALEAGVLLGAAYKWSGTLWLPIGIHWAWNFVQGNVFGIAVSGQDAGASLLEASIEGPAWLTGGAFGAEASVLSAVLGLALSAFFLSRIIRQTPR